MTVIGTIPLHDTVNSYTLTPFSPRKKKGEENRMKIPRFANTSLPNIIFPETNFRPMGAASHSSSSVFSTAPATLRKFP